MKDDRGKEDPLQSWRQSSSYRGPRKIVRDGLVYGLEVSARRKNGRPALDFLESLLMASRADNVTFKRVQ